MRRLDDRNVKLHVQTRFRSGVGGAMRIVHGGQGLIEDLEVGGRGALGSIGAGDALHLAAVFEEIEDGARVAAHESDHRLFEDRADDLRDVSALAVARAQQAAKLQLLQCVAENGTRDVEDGRELALRREPVARAQHAVEDALLDLPYDGVSRPVVNYALKHGPVR